MAVPAYVKPLNPQAPEPSQAPNEGFWAYHDDDVSALLHSLIAGMPRNVIAKFPVTRDTSQLARFWSKLSALSKAYCTRARRGTNGYGTRRNLEPTSEHTSKLVRLAVFQLPIGWLNVGWLWKMPCGKACTHSFARRAWPCVKRARERASAYKHARDARDVPAADVSVKVLAPDVARSTHRHVRHSGARVSDADPCGIRCTKEVVHVRHRRHVPSANVPIGLRSCRRVSAPRVDSRLQRILVGKRMAGELAPLRRAIVLRRHHERGELSPHAQHVAGIRQLPACSDCSCSDCSDERGWDCRVATCETDALLLSLSCARRLSLLSSASAHTH